MGKKIIKTINLCWSELTDEAQQEIMSIIQEELAGDDLRNEADVLSIDYDTLLSERVDSALRRDEVKFVFAP